MTPVRRFIFSGFVVSITLAAAYVEELDERFNEMRKSEPWLVEFYAPWCEYCKTLELMWHDVASELKSQGSHVNVGKMDTTVYANAVTEYKIRGYPSIIFMKGEKHFHYHGQRTKDAILEFTNRVSGPFVRVLSSTQVFQHALSHHQLFFLYVGGRSPLKETCSSMTAGSMNTCFPWAGVEVLLEGSDLNPINMNAASRRMELVITRNKEHIQIGQFYKVASEFVIYNYFFSATTDIVPQAVTLPDAPSVAVFKDGSYDVYDEFRDGNLSSWVDRERFPRYFLMDSFTLYQMGERDKLVAVAVVDEKTPSAQSLGYKGLVETVAAEHGERYGTKFQFGYVDGNEYINGVMMGELPVPSIIVMNMSIDGYYLPGSTLKTSEDLLEFLNSILTGRSEILGGNGFLRQIKRLYYRATSTVKTSFASSPFGTCFLFSLPLVVIGFLIAGICTAERVDDGKAEDGDRPAVTRGKRSAARQAEAKKKD